MALAAVIGYCAPKSSHCTGCSPGGLEKEPSLHSHCFACEYTSRNQLGTSCVWMILRTSIPVPHQSNNTAGPVQLVQL